MSIDGFDKKLALGGLRDVSNTFDKLAFDRNLKKQKLKDVKEIKTEIKAKRPKKGDSILEVICNPTALKKYDPHIGPLKKDIFEVAKDLKTAEKRLPAEIENLTKFERKMVGARLTELKKMVEYANNLKDDHFNTDIINKLVNYRLELKQEGITDMFPKKLVIEDKDEGILVDENGKAYDTLRNKKDGDSVTEKFIEFCDKREGNYSYIDNTTDGYYSAQVLNSWSKTSWLVKYKVKSYRDVPDEEYHLNPKFDTSPFLIADDEDYLQYLSDFDWPEQTFDNTVLMFMAFNMEFLTKTDIPGKNEENQTIQIFRTETKNAISNAEEDEDNPNKFTMKRGPVESGSILAAVTQWGYQVTVQDVPFHRIVGTYLTEKLCDREKEFLCVFQGIPFTKLGSIDKYEENLAKYEANLAK